MIIKWNIYENIVHGDYTNARLIETHTLDTKTNKRLIEYASKSNKSN